MPVAPSIISATRGTINILQARRVVDMDDTLHLLEPAAAPLLRFTGKPDDSTALIKKQSCFNPKFDWLEDQTIPGTDTVNNAAGYSAAATSIVVTNGGYFTVDDVIHISRTNELLYVSAVASNTLTVTRGYAGSTAATMLNGEEFIRLGTAKAEGSTSMTSKSTNEVDQFNYCQIYRNTVAITGTEAASKLYGGPDRPYQRKKRGIELAKDMERSFMFGRRNEDTSGAQPRRTSGGLRQFVTSNVTNVAGGLLAEPTFENWIRTGMRYPPESKSKVAVASALIISAVSSWARGKLLLNPKSEEYGIQIMTYLSPHGRINLVRHWMLEGTEYQGWSFLVNMDDLKYRFLEGRDVKLWTDTQNNDADFVQDEYIAEVGYQIVWNDHHAILRGVAGY